MLDPYEVLGVDRAADEAAVHRAYRVLAKRLHPDLNPGDPTAERRFKALSEAYAILGNRNRRARWDRGEREGILEADPFPFDGQEADAGPTAPLDTGARVRLFEDFYSEKTPDEVLHSARPGDDVDYRITVPFLVAARGGRQLVRLAAEREVEVEIPAGIEDGEHLRIAGAGLPGPQDGPPGDAICRVSVLPHPLFRREGADLHLELPIGLREAVMGARVQVATLNGSVAAKIPPGSDGKTRLRLRGRGLPMRGRKERGDLYLRLVILLPEDPPPSLGAILSVAEDRSAEQARERLFRQINDGTAVRADIFED
jgi:DnaJ-class molecular chaperone